MQIPALLQVQCLVVVVHDTAFDDDGADELVVAPQLVDQVFPPATSLCAINSTIIISYNAGV